jgi:YHS domain-containing protein
MIAKDPVCGERVDTTSAVARVTYGGRVYYFCSTLCRERFAANPEHYAFRNPGPQ